MSISVSFSFRLAKFGGQLPAHGHAYEHAHARLLGEQRLHARGALGLVGPATAERSSDWCAVPNQLPSSSACASTRWSVGRPRHEPLRPGEAIRIRERAHGGIDLLVGEHRRDATSAA